MGQRLGALLARPTIGPASGHHADGQSQPRQNEPEHRQRRTQSDDAPCASVPESRQERGGWPLGGWAPV